MRSPLVNLTDFCLGLGRLLFPSRQEKKRRQWESLWSRDDYKPKWGDRNVSPEIVEAVKTGWLPAHGTVLDIGCGLGEVAGWFAERGYAAVAFDIAESAVAKGREMHRHLTAPPEFLVLDICTGQPPDRQYNILIDRGCLHQISRKETHNYVRNIVAVAAPDARLMLFVRAFRCGRVFGNPAETARHVEQVGKTFAGVFAIERVEETYLDRNQGKDTASALPGLVFWLTRSPAHSGSVQK